MEKSSRKRHATDSSSGSSAATKKRKKSSKRDQSSQDAHTHTLSEPSPLTLHTSTPLTTHTSTPLETRANSPAKKSSKRDKPSKRQPPHITVHNSTTSTPHTSTPSTVAKQKPSKRDQSSQDSAPSSQAPPLTTHPSKKPKVKKPSAHVSPADPGSGGGSEQGGTDAVKAGKKRKLTEAEEPVTLTQDPFAEATKKVRRKPRTFYLRPINGTWDRHISAVLVYRCVSQAMLLSIDPRKVESDFSWGRLMSGFLSAQDMERIWGLISFMYPDQSLSDVREELRPFTTVTMEEQRRARVKEKYKNEFPKPPATPYMLFVRDRSSVLRAKHPKLTQIEIAKKLGKKWQAMGAEKQERYKQQYQELKKEYEAKLADFYVHHPDAKVPIKFRRNKPEQESPEEKRIKELKAIQPVAPLSPYMLFCKAKRAKVQAKYPDLHSREVTRKLSAKWKGMTTEEKSKYQHNYDKEMTSYKQRLKLFYEMYPDAKTLLSRSKKPSSVSAVEDHSTQTSYMATPAKPSSVPEKESEDSSDDETEDSSDDGKESVASDEAGVGGASNENEAEIIQMDDEESDDSDSSDTGEVSVESSSLVIPATLLTPDSKSHVQSHDLSSDDDPSTSSDSDFS